MPPHKVGEVKSILDQQYETAYATLKYAVEKRDPDKYFEGLQKLTEALRNEVQQNYGTPNKGETPFTFMDWHRETQYIPEEKIKKGEDVVTLSNAIDGRGNIYNQEFQGDTIMHENSRNRGDTVAQFVNKRGHEFIATLVVPRESLDKSFFQVQTTFKGFRPAASK